jgi:hypothetical protein
MATKVYGSSDDLIEFDGDFSGEVLYYLRGERGDAREKGILIFMSDGTILEIRFGKNDGIMWEVKLVKTGDLLEKIDQCDNSDVAYFKEGVKWAYAARVWEKVS